MHEQWKPFYFTDIARQLADAKLVFAGSARYVNMQPVAWLTAAQAEVVNTIADPAMAEELRDYFSNQSFRSDIFAKGRAPLNDARLREHARHVHLWGDPRTQFQAQVSLAHATVDRKEELHKPLFDLLRRGDTTLAEVFDAPEFAGHSIDTVMELVRFSLALGETRIRYGAVPPRAAADRLNATLLARAERGEEWDALASPRLAGGVPYGQLDQILVAALCGGDTPDARHALAEDIDEIAARAAQAFIRTGRQLNVKGEAAPAGQIPGEIRDMLASYGETLIAHFEANDVLPAGRLPHA
jgi:hypothetical protein